MVLKRQAIFAMVVLLAFNLITTACLAKQAGNVYASSENGYTITFPDDWAIVSKDNSGNISVGKPKAVHMSVAVRALAKGISLAQAMQEERDIMAFVPSASDYTLLDQGTMLIDGREARWQSFTIKINDLVVRMVEYGVINDGRFYKISGAARADQFDNYTELINQTVKTWKFSK